MGSEICNQEQQGKMIGRKRYSQNQNKNPFVLLSRNDFEIAEEFLRDDIKTKNQNVRSVPNKRAVSTVKTKSLSHVAKNKESISTETKQCLFCRTSSLTDGRFDDVDTGSRFNLYKQLVQTLDFNYGLPHVQFIDEKLQFCCQDCHQAVHQLWELQQVLEEIRLEMSDIVESMKKAIEVKRPVILMKQKSNISLRRVRDECLSSLHSKTSEAVSDDTVQIESTQTEGETNFSSSFLDLPYLDIENESVLEAVDNTNKSFDLHSPKQVVDDHEEVMDMKMEPIYIDDDADDYLESGLTNKLEPEILPNQDLKKPVRSSKLRAEQFLKKLARDLEETGTLESTKISAIVKNTSAVDSYEDEEDDEFKSIHKDDDDIEYRPELSDNSNESDSDSDQVSISSEEGEVDFSFSKDSLISSNPSASKNNSSTEIEKIQQNDKLSETSEMHIQEVETSKNTHKCSYCILAFSSSHGKMHHIRNKHTTKQYKTTTQNQPKWLQPSYCNKCKKSFYNSAALKKHTRRVHEKRKSCKCPTCEFPFYSMFEMNRHIRVVHLKEKPKSFLCDKCGAVFSSFNSRKRHDERIHEGLKNYNCPHCKLLFDRKTYMNRHIRTVHLGEKLKSFRCDKCEAVLSSLRSLKGHVERIHERVKNHTCPGCKHPFHTKTEMYRHIRTVHHGEKPFQCSKCLKRFKSLYCQVQHEQLVCTSDSDEEGKKIVPEKQKSFHNREKAKGFKCVHCRLSFIKESNMEFHIKTIHPDNFKPKPECDRKKLICEQCNNNKQFNCRTALTQHIKRVHEGLKEFQCEKCGNSFSSLRNLNRHVERIHERLKNHNCPHCKFPFHSKSDMNRHIRKIHLWEKPYQCSKCGERFSSTTYLTEHVNLVCGADKQERARRSKKQEEFRSAQMTRGQKSPKCMKQFRSELKLKWHVGKAHNEEIEMSSHKKRIRLLIRRHDCYFCEKTFYSKSEIFQHMSKHTKERSTRASSAKRTSSKFKCETCWLSFKNDEDLKNHLRSYHEILKGNLAGENNPEAVELEQLEIYNIDGTDVVGSSILECEVELDTQQPQHESTVIQENVVDCSARLFN